ncbi:MAG: DUF1223 domain-containing protein [Bacillota bacterium]
MRRSIGLSLAIGLGLSANVVAAPQTITGPETRVSVLELYTSEGCSSCPPAEEWISRLQQDPRLWKQLVPVTFHVDYWDYLGWRDPFDSPAYTERQQEIAAQADSLAGHVVYTPQFVLDGHDWRGWVLDQPLRPDDSSKVGALNLSTDGRKVTVRFAPTTSHGDRYEAHVTLLAFGVDVAVGDGENKGVTLRHDFLVVSDTAGSLTEDKTGNYQGIVNLPPPVKVKATRYALAAWVSRAGDPVPQQAAGGWLREAP